MRRLEKYVVGLEGNSMQLLPLRYTIAFQSAISESCVLLASSSSRAATHSLECLTSLALGNTTVVGSRYEVQRSKMQELQVRRESGTCIAPGCPSYKLVLIRTLAISLRKLLSIQHSMIRFVLLYVQQSTHYSLLKRFGVINQCLVRGACEIIPFIIRHRTSNDIMHLKELLNLQRRNLKRWADEEGAKGDWRWPMADGSWFLISWILLHKKCYLLSTALPEWCHRPKSCCIYWIWLKAFPCYSLAYYILFLFPSAESFSSLSLRSRGPWPILLWACYRLPFSSVFWSEGPIIHNIFGSSGKLSSSTTLEHPEWPYSISTVFHSLLS